LPIGSASISFFEKDLLLLFLNSLFPSQISISDPFFFSFDDFYICWLERFWELFLLWLRLSSFLAKEWLLLTGKLDDIALRFR
jgi:hypothetical protein